MTVTVEHERLSEYAERVAVGLDIRGPANIQFIESADGEMWCTDINPRFGGAYIASVRAGLNSPVFLLDELAGESIAYNGYETNLLMMRHWSEDYEHGYLV